VPEWGEPGDVGGVDRVSVRGEMVEGGLDVYGLPEHDYVDHDAEAVPGRPDKEEVPDSSQDSPIGIRPVQAGYLGGLPSRFLPAGSACDRVRRTRGHLPEVGACGQDREVAETGTLRCAAEGAMARRPGQSGASGGPIACDHARQAPVPAGLAPPGGERR
jgi:hypothetical protein